MSIFEVMKQTEKKLLTNNEVKFSPGDTISVSLKVREGDKERLQTFSGIVIKKRGSGMGTTFTLRKASENVFVERTFPLHSPLISEIKLIKRGRVRRAKLYYVRRAKGKSTRIQEKK